MTSLSNNTTVFAGHTLGLVVLELNVQAILDANLHLDRVVNLRLLQHAQPTTHFNTLSTGLYMITTAQHTHRFRVHDPEVLLRDKVRSVVACGRDANEVTATHIHTIVRIIWLVTSTSKLKVKRLHAHKGTFTTNRPITQALLARTCPDRSSPADAI